jgi:hypothetical protein
MHSPDHLPALAFRVGTAYPRETATPSGEAGGGSRPGLSKDRLKKLAEAIEALTAKDSALIEKTLAIAALRRHAAVQLHAICRAFVKDLNQHLSSAQVDFDPPEYLPESFQEIGVNLLQINVRGRILQIEFAATPQTVSTENFRVPHIIEGSVRCFNQEFLDRAIVEEQYIFYCLEKKRNLWRFFDSRTYRSGPFDQEYLASLMEQVI